MRFAAADAYPHVALGAILPSPRFKPRGLSSRRREHAIGFVRSAVITGSRIAALKSWAREVIPSISLASETNKRNDKWGGEFERRCRFPEEILKRIREAVGPDFAIMYRLSMLDLVAGVNWSEVERLAQIVEAAGADVINTGIGWHEAHPDDRHDGTTRRLPLCDPRIDGQGERAVGRPTDSTILKIVNPRSRRDVRSDQHGPSVLGGPAFGEEGQAFRA